MLPRRRRVAFLFACVATTVGAEAATTASAAATRYQAETAPTAGDGALESHHAGYSGSGFSNGNTVHLCPTTGDYHSGVAGAFCFKAAGARQGAGVVATGSA